MPIDLLKRSEVSVPLTAAQYDQNLTTLETAVNALQTDVVAAAGAASAASASAATRLASNDASVTNAREWTAATVDQAEAEAGSATTRRAWTAQRVRQAISSWAASAFKTINGSSILGTGNLAIAVDTPLLPTAIGGSRSMTAGDDGGRFEVGGALTLTIPAGLPAGWAVFIDVTLGTTTIAASGVTLNGAGTSLTRTKPFSIIRRAAADTFTVTE
jgi:hypothetical protein